LDSGALDQDIQTQLPDGALDEGYQSLPASVGLNLRPSTSDRLLPLVHEAHFALIRQAARSAKNLRGSVRAAHSPGVLGYLRAATGRDIPDPAYIHDGVPEPDDEAVDIVPLPQRSTAKPVDYLEPDFSAIQARVRSQGLRIDERDLRRYYLSLKTRGFVILSGLSGTGKTWLAQAYAQAVGARSLLVPVAPNWTTNEDLLGFFNPIQRAYQDTSFSRFLREAAEAYRVATAAGVTPKPFHLILDEMNLARVEYYFARFLSAMEVRARDGQAPIELAPGEFVSLSSNFCFIGTVNMDETTHTFADKVYDRAQLIDLSVSRQALAEHLGDAPFAARLLDMWESVHRAAPFAFRVVDEIRVYVQQAHSIGVVWEEAFDEQLLQKILPKIKGAEHSVGFALEAFIRHTEDICPLSHMKATRMLEGYRAHGIASYF